MVVKSYLGQNLDVSCENRAPEPNLAGLVTFWTRFWPRRMNKSLTIRLNTRLSDRERRELFKTTLIVLSGPVERKISAIVQLVYNNILAKSCVSLLSKGSFNTIHSALLCTLSALSILFAMLKATSRDEDDMIEWCLLELSVKYTLVEWISRRIAQDLASNEIGPIIYIWQTWDTLSKDSFLRPMETKTLLPNHPVSLSLEKGSK